MGVSNGHIIDMANLGSATWSNVARFYDNSLKNWPTRPSICFIFVLFNTHFCGIRTRIVGLEGDYTDHLTTTSHFKANVFRDFQIVPNQKIYNKQKFYNTVPRRNINRHIR